LLDETYPTITELPFISVWGGGRKEREKIFPKYRVAERFSLHLRTTWLPEHHSSPLFINHMVAPYW
jgi:hypothetical protein